MSNLSTQFEDIQNSLLQTAQKADAAMDLGLVNQADIKQLQEATASQRVSLIFLETEVKPVNLKFQGIREEAEENNDMITFMTSLIAQALSLEEGVFPTITQAYRMGTLARNRRLLPRDILITVPGARVRRRILDAAKTPGTFKHEGNPLQVSSDIPREAILIRRTLKPIITKLQSIKQKYCWLPSGKLYAAFQGQHLYAWDEDSGADLLHIIQGEAPMEQDELIDITCTLLLLNPDFTTAWNVRKELILSGTLNPVKDLHLGKLALTKFPKSPETWIHRRWVLQQLIQENSLPTLVTKGNLEMAPTERIQRLVKEEMDVCCEAAGRYPSNYNAWSHRIWVLQHLAKLSTKILLDELSSTKHWVSMHVSDHSGFHYRQFLLKSLIVRTVTDYTVQMHNQPNNQQAPSLPKAEETDEAEAAYVEEQRPDHPFLLKEEAELCTDLINSYPGHETLWCHRRHVFYLQHHLKNKLVLPSTWAVAADSSDGTLNNTHPGGALGHVTQAMDIDGLIESNKQGYTQEIKRLKRAPLQDSVNLEAEYRFIDQVLSTCRDVEQARFAGAYRKWLGSFLGQ
ncbi:PREDICTED: protein prenyltransferase alpha subunit repeat-containing protein 1 [Gekko japonicus]|uniref:Protein prenyltransferase alpha subunit repeat-containing protein 1 n=1 Tax=Gekko japonicus TaxID=146911 RepID=A0ABM1JIR9_GEKJA|nr:PREDICTED: protein prenyltransferase alpha subunit repeat-containing protein 1 [Gekko japonicus]